LFDVRHELVADGAPSILQVVCEVAHVDDVVRSPNLSNEPGALIGGGTGGCVADQRLS
jgi:hypothetical protein